MDEFEPSIEVAVVAEVVLVAALDGVDGVDDEDAESCMPVPVEAKVSKCDF
jgi:hypothetical protein